jgi:hypothetical protein
MICAAAYLLLGTLCLGGVQVAIYDARPIPCPA